MNKVIGMITSSFLPLILIKLMSYRRNTKTGHIGSVSPLAPQQAGFYKLSDHLRCWISASPIYTIYFM